MSDHLSKESRKIDWIFLEFLFVIMTNCGISTMEATWLEGEKEKEKKLSSILCLETSLAHVDSIELETISESSC